MGQISPCPLRTGRRNGENNEIIDYRRKTFRGQGYCPGDEMWEGRKRISGGRTVYRHLGLGHLVELADPEEYDPGYKQWKMEDLPMLPEPFKLRVIPQTARQYAAVKARLARKDVSDVIIATDAGREGELVARLILKKASCKKPIRRLWISSVTDKAIREYSKELTSQIKAGEGSFRHDNLTNTRCPVCGKRMLAVKGKNSEMLLKGKGMGRSLSAPAGIRRS